MAKLSLGLGKKAPSKKKTQIPVETHDSLYQKALDKMQADEYILQGAYRKENYELAAEMFDQLGDYQDASQLAALCREKAKAAEGEITEERYTLACRKEKTAQYESEWKDIAQNFRELGEYKDASDHLKRAQKQIVSLNKKAKHRRYIVGGVLAGIVLVIVSGMYTGLFRYIYGWGFMQVGAYGQARSTFTALGDFMDSEEKAIRCKYLSIEETNVGSTVTFADRTWRILKKEDGRALMIMGVPDEGETLRLITWNNGTTDTAWETCSLRAYLNREDGFLSLFTEDERTSLVTQQVKESRNVRYGTAYETETEDLVSILSAEEAALYASYLSSIRVDMWLRTPGSTYSTAAFRSGAGELMYYGYPAQQAQLAALPVILVDYEAALAAAE